MRKTHEIRPFLFWHGKCKRKQPVHTVKFVKQAQDNGNFSIPCACLYAWTGLCCLYAQQGNTIIKYSYSFSLTSSNFFRFRRSLLLSLSLTTEERLSVVISRDDVLVLSTTWKWRIRSRTWGTTAPRSCQFHIFTCSFCLLQLVLFHKVMLHWSICNANLQWFDVARKMVLA